MTATHPHTNRRPPTGRRRVRRPVLVDRTPRRTCPPDPEFRARTHRHAFLDDHGRTAPHGDPLFPQR